MRTRSRTPQSGRAEDAERESSAMSKMLNVEVQLASKMPGSLIPTWAKKNAEQALTPGRMTPARYRFDAAVAYHANYASTNNGPCLEITPAVRCRTSLALMHKRPMRCNGFFCVTAKTCILCRVTRRELAESRQNAGICWFRAPRHYSASRLVVTRPVPTAPRYQCLRCHATRFPTQGRL